MLYISDIYTDAPREYKTILERKVYEKLRELGIPFERVETGEVITMEQCADINAKLNMNMVKTLFLCNRQQTEFFLFVTMGDKPFHTKEFSAALDIARVSFAPPELMESILGTKIGAATVFSVLLESARNVRLVLDRDVADLEFYGCSDGTTSCYLKLRTADIVRRLLPAVGWSAELIRI